MSHLMRRARDFVRGSERLIVLTGAGLSAESGVPTFRGPDGLWRSFRPEELATPAAFARDPRLVWEWYDWRRRQIRECRPNAAHQALATVALAGPERARLVTQNVDGLQTVALREANPGATMTTADIAPLELHGSIFRVRCTACDDRHDHIDPVDTSRFDTLPRCLRCTALLRPDVVWFGEPLDGDVLGEAVARARHADVCLVIGTSAVVYPAASVALVAKRSGGILIEINPEPTPLTPLADVSIRGMAASVVPGVVS